MLKKLKDPRPTNEAEGKTTGASRTKPLENGRDSETSTTRESSADADLETSGFTSVLKSAKVFVLFCCYC